MAFNSNRSGNTTNGRPISFSGNPCPRDLSTWANDLYANTGFLMRLMAKYRPRICPFHLLVAEINPGMSVLDIGCGNGLLLTLLARCSRLREGIGVDSSRAAIGVANRVLHRLRCNLSEARLRFEHLNVGQPWPEGLFDAVLLVDVLHHIPPASQRKVFHDAARKVKGGGKFIYKDLSARPFLCGAMNRLHDLLLARQWVHYTPVELVEQWAQEEGLELAETRDIRMLWYQHQIRIFARVPRVRQQS